VIKRNGRMLVLGVVSAMLTAAGLGVLAGSLEPPGAPAPTMKTLDEVEPRIPIHAADLPLTISSPGSYYFVEDITTAGNGITVNSSDVTIDLMGHTLTGGTNNGISAPPGFENIVLKNGTVTGWQFSAVNFYNATHSQVINVVARDNGDIGIRVGPGGSVIDSEAIDNTSSGITAEAVSVVRGCRSKDNGAFGILARDSSLISECVVTGNGAAGITTGGPGVIVRGCTASGNQDGIRAFEKAVIVGNNCTSNTDDGIDLSSGSDNRVEGNHATGNGDNGIVVTTMDNLIIRNSAGNNGVGPADDFDIVAGNDAGPIGTAAASTSPWANIQY
jgi:parallel beta-helix repeat protein